MAGKISLPITEEKRPVQCRTRRRCRPFLFLTLVAISLYAVYNLKAVSSYAVLFVPESAQSRLSPTTDRPISVDRELVPLEAHIMSKCPDARDCLKDLVLPSMMRVYDKVNFTLSYIGTPTENDGVECKHGPGECMGNIIELCAHHLYPDPKIYLGFTMCLTKDYKLIPQRELVEDCALEHAIDFEKLNECATKDNGGYGVDLLRQSVARSSSVRFTENRNLKGCF
ncbi:hypothetical protein F4805DRAFT_453264 [Annulohypoxylon moriforme]|nr:hypothetical protein F4805DRAFT_453264 [Annulohypoxylon moriforme]